MVVQVHSSWLTVWCSIQSNLKCFPVDIVNYPSTHVVDETCLHQLHFLLIAHCISFQNTHWCMLVAIFHFVPHIFLPVEFFFFFTQRQQLLQAIYISMDAGSIH